MFKKFCSAWLAVFCLTIILAAPALARETSNVPARDDGVVRQLLRDGLLASTDGGKLDRSIANVMIERHGECRWLDNNNSSFDYFVPTGTPADWQSFYENAPADVRIDRCCPAKQVTLRASDNTTFAINLPVGRENSTGAFGQRDLSHTFDLVNAEGAAWSETVTERFICDAGEWTGQGANIAGAPGEWDIAAWGACSADCEGTQTRTVVCRDDGGAVVADALCGNKPATSRPCGASTCDVAEGAGVCGDATQQRFDRSTPPPGTSGRSLCAEGTPTAVVRADAITWQWQCQGAEGTATCRTIRTGAAVHVASDCRPEHMNSPSTLDFHASNQYYTYVCGVDRRMPKNRALSPAHWQISQMVNNYSGKYSCLQAGYPIMLGARTGGDDWHKAYYTGWTPRAGTDGSQLSHYYMSSRGDQCEGCVELASVYCTDEPDFPRGCAAVSGLDYWDVPSANCAGRDIKYTDGSLPEGYYGEVKYLEDSEFTCGFYGWVDTGLREERTNPLQQTHTQRCF